MPAFSNSEAIVWRLSRARDNRHTLGTWLAQNGADIYVIARYMGHEDLESTRRYTHHNAESLRASIGSIEKLTGRLDRILAESK